jgi:hypothetical protein
MMRIGFLLCELLPITSSSCPRNTPAFANTTSAYAMPTADKTVGRRKTRKTGIFTLWSL